MILDYSSVCWRSPAYVVRYLFDKFGVFKQVTQSTIDKDSHHDEIEIAKTSLLTDLGPYELCDIRIQPFEVTIDGITFGFSYSEETKSVDVTPGPLITFMAPWDGEYYT